MSLPGRLILGLVTVAVITAATLASSATPNSHTIDARDISGSYGPTRAGGVDKDRPRAWRMQLLLDHDLPLSGVEWAMREGKSYPGHEMTWIPGGMSLQIHRSGISPLLLGAVRLARPPSDITFARRGCLLIALVDGTSVLEVLDPEGVAEPEGTVFPDGWMLETPSNLGTSTLIVQDDGDLPPAYASDLPTGNRTSLLRAITRGPLDQEYRQRIGLPYSRNGDGRDDYALLCVRHALSFDIEREPLATLQAIATAGKAVATLGSGHPDHSRLKLWLAWAEARNALHGAGSGDATRIRPAIDQLMLIAQNTRTPEGLGMILALLPGLTERAVSRPTIPRPLRDVLSDRAAWLANLDAAARAATTLLDLDAGDGTQLQLAFISHASGALLGSTHGDDLESPRIRPTPASAPDWLSARWRAIAGDDCLVTVLPPPPVSAVSRNLLLPVINLLVRSAGLEPLPALRLRAALLDAEPSNPFLTSPQITQRFDATRTREAALARVIIALRLCDKVTAGEPRLQAAQDALQLTDIHLGKLRERHEESDPPQWLIYRDPLAYALACLAESRTRRIRISAGNEIDIHRAPEPPPELSQRSFARLLPFARLLGLAEGNMSASGTHDGDPTDLIWLHDDAILPPAQALAVALAMQEVAGKKPDWSLLRQLPSYTLPLEMLEPTRPIVNTGTKLTPAIP